MYEEDDWASEASPTLGCSIEISRDIYIEKWFPLQGERVHVLLLPFQSSYPA